ncbi:MAG TPA: molybdenum cofactor guanylyltransferase [Methanoregulaceae archaeon]|nr:molybdenum cofactor guanylyltransferase [Methanoregulaceae archaeon]HQJ86919.1 molybdenum cofactor guanylyltransferase [Methanoregulaceae archaeon]
MKRSAVILVGGEAVRAGGQEKYFFSLQGTTFLERLIRSLTPITDEVVIVARDADQCNRFSSFSTVRVTVDRRRGIGPIGGLHAGALTATGESLFVVACDMPLVNPGVVEHLFSLLDDWDAVIPCWREDMLEPLHAVYRRDPLRRYLEDHRELSLRAMIRSLHCRYVPVESLRTLDPGLRTFTNINRLDELARLDGEMGSQP